MKIGLDLLEGARFGKIDVTSKKASIMTIDQFE